MSEQPVGSQRSVFRRVGPAFVVGAVIIGPGSVTVMSTTGATCGYQLLWLSLLAGGLMAGFIALFMRFGIHSDETFFSLTTKKLGRPYAALTGLSLFSAGAAFQCGNNLGVTAGMHALIPGVPQILWPLLFTTAAVIFLFTARNIYRVLEKVMTVFLVGMFLAFLANLIRAKPDLGAAARGMVLPSIPEGADWVTLGGLVATTFVIAAAIFQSYLVKAKGWHAQDLKNAALDTILASITYTLIGTVIMMTAAAMLYPHEGTVGFGTMVAQLEGVFGQYAVLIFAVGFWAAAFSSFITNALIAGLLLADGLGIAKTIQAPETKRLATVAMLIGTTAAIVVLHYEKQTTPPRPTSAAVASTAPATTQQADAATDGESPAPPKRRDLKITAIRIGQACSLVAIPLGAIAMIVVLFDTRAVKGHGLPIWAQAFVLLGAIVLFATTLRTASGLIKPFLDAK